MAPELLNVEQNPEKSGTPTRQSDVFAFGMVAIEVIVTPSFDVLIVYNLRRVQVFTGQVPFPENERSYIVIRKVAEGGRPPRPPKSTKLGLSDELWAVVQSSWSHEATDRPSLSTFVELLERVNPDIAVLEELTRFDVHSNEHIDKLRAIFEFADNALLGMRENETLIEVFDKVGTCSSFSPFPSNYHL
jgi:hypothetical protein